MKLYLTEYVENVSGAPRQDSDPDGCPSAIYLADNDEYGCYGSAVWAASEAQALRLIAMRGIKEKILDYNHRMYEPDRYPPKWVLPSTALLTNHISYALHSVVWLSNLATRCLDIKPSEVLGDQGIVHELAHMIEASHRVDLRIESAHHAHEKTKIKSEFKEQLQRWRERLAPKVIAMEIRVPGLTVEFAEKELTTFNSLKKDVA